MTFDEMRQLIDRSYPYTELDSPGLEIFALACDLVQFENHFYETFLGKPYENASFIAMESMVKSFAHSLISKGLILDSTMNGFKVRPFYNEIFGLHLRRFILESKDISADLFFVFFMKAHLASLGVQAEQIIENHAEMRLGKMRATQYCKACSSPLEEE